MKWLKLFEYQIVYAIRQADASPPPVGVLCRQLGISAATYYKWKAKDEGRGERRPTSLS